MKSPKSLQKYHEALDVCKTAIEKVQEITRSFDTVPKCKALVTKAVKLRN